MTPGEPQEMIDMRKNMGASAIADQALVASPSSRQGVSTEGFDPSRFEGRLFIRCTGFGCKHARGVCTADPDYQRYIAWKRGEEEKTKERVLQWPVTHGYVRMTFPSAMTPEEVADVEAVVGITLDVMRERAAAPKADAQKGSA
jgi:hypothetical protein